MPLSLSQTLPLELPSSLSLSPRLKLLLTFFRVDPFVKPINEWQLKLSLLHFLRSSISLPISDADDLSVAKLPDLHKRKRDDPVAKGTLYVRELGFLEKKGEDVGEWRERMVEKLGGIELNLEGVKFEMRVKVPEGDDFEKVKRDWKDFYRVTGNRKDLETLTLDFAIFDWFLVGYIYLLLMLYVGIGFMLLLRNSTNTENSIDPEGGNPKPKPKPKPLF